MSGSKLFGPKYCFFLPNLKVLEAGGYLEGVWGVSRGGLECVWKVSGWCLYNARKMSGSKLFEPNYGFCQILEVLEAGDCLEGAWGVSRGCLECFWKVAGGCLDDVWKVSGSKLSGPNYGFCQI